MKQRNCWPWGHKWTRWTETARYTKKRFSCFTNDLIGMEIVSVQERECETCGKRQVTTDTIKL